jgi:predicted Zn-dependent protease
VLGRQTGPSAGAVTETTEAVPLHIGFFSMLDSGKDKALLDSAAGACAFSSGDREKAGLKFREAVKADPSCLSCMYFLAVSEAGAGHKAEAERLLRSIEQSAPQALGAEHHTLIRDLLAGNTAGAAGAAREIESKDPYFFLGGNLENALLPRRQTP